MTESISGRNKHHKNLDLLQHHAPFPVKILRQEMEHGSHGQMAEDLADAMPHRQLGCHRVIIPMTDPWCCYIYIYIYMVTWIPSIYSLYVSIYTSTMDPSWDIQWWVIQLKQHDRTFLGEMATSQVLLEVSPRTNPHQEVKENALVALWHLNVCTCLYPPVLKCG